MEKSNMTSSNTHDTNGNGIEPSMFVQRPSSDSCQDISHILTRIFRDEYAKDTIDQDTVRNLTTSRSKKSDYHSQYVEKLQQIQCKWENVMQDAKTIEMHLKGAYSLARENEMLQEKRAAEECPNYKDLGLPSVESHLDSHLNADLLRRFNLIVPRDFIKEEREIITAKEGDDTPQYARPTTSSMQRYRKTPIEDNYHVNESEDAQPKMTYEIDILKIEPDEKENMKSSNKKMYLSSKSGEKNIWRDLMKPSQRQVERNDLAKLQQRADFLKNPRFAPPKATKKVGATELESSSRGTEELNRYEQNVLEPIPNPVVFTNYQVGKVYEITLSLKNITSSSRQLRVIPPTSSYFSVSHGKFPTSNGLLAPGMSCQYCIKFTPDSLADYDDILKVETHFSDPLFIPLQARRPPPQLTLSDTFNCGHCLVGGKKTVEFSCSNVGGEGRFCIVPKNKWPGATQKDFLDSNGQVDVGPFVIQPNMFHLKPNENINIMITFSPNAVKKCKESVVFVCDNCNTKEFKIEGSGETPSVELVSVEGGCNEYLLGESRDNHAGYLVRFPGQNPGTIQKKDLKIKNITSVELEYYWIIDRPIHIHAENNILSNKALDNIKHSPVFEIIPSNGKLAPMDTSTFNILFKPAELIEYYNVARLLLRNVPCTSSEGLLELSDLITTQIEMKGYTKPFDVRTYPEVLIVDESVEINQPLELNFKICNHSPSSCSLRWKNIEDVDCSLQIEPNIVEIDPMEEVQCCLICVGKRPGFLRRTLVGEMPYSAAPIYCHFEANFTGPIIRFADSLLNFGLVRFKDNQSRLIELKNFSSIEATWRVNEDHPELFAIEPTSGRIGSFESQVMLVKLHADMECILNDMIEIQVAEGDNCYIETRAIIQRPEVRFLSSTLDVEDCFVGIHVVKKIIMQNLTLFSAQYKWVEVTGNDATICSVEFKNISGQLRPREKLEVELMICAKKKVNINDLIAVCEVEGMQEPLLLSITAEVKGLKIDFSTPDVRGDQISDEAGTELKLEFGYDVPISSQPRAVLVMENKSAIPTQFSLAVEHFCAGRVPTPPDKRDSGKKGHRKLLLAKTTNNADSMGIDANRASKEQSSAALSEMKGVAFRPIPSHGRIGPFQKIVIEVIAYMDMWGEYNDFLLCEADGLDVVKVPIHIECVGCPLNFQISKEQQPIVRFGSHISGGETCCRSLRINNTSPCDIRLDWQSYINVNDDVQILDLFLMIGNPFPLLDEDNREVESDEDVTEPLVKVRLNPHDGMLSSEPLAMEPKQLIVPAKGYAKAIAKFIPVQNTRKTIPVSGYALGYMSLTHKDKFHDEQKHLRCDGIDVDPFPLSITGNIQPARLVVEPESENGFVFETMTSDLIDMESGYLLRKEHFSIRRFIIANNSGTTIRFSANLRQPFRILSVDGTDMIDVAFNRDLVIKQSANIKVKVGMQITHSLINELIEATENEACPDTENPLENRFAKKEVMQSLDLVFPNDTKQTYNLKGLIHLPVLILQSKTLDFGTCLIGQERELHVVLRNLGKSACYWQVSMDKDCPETSRAVFSISPSEGYLDGDMHHDSKNYQTIKVLFNARQSASYECQITFADILVRHPVSLKLIGKGSHDQVSEKLVNILT